MCRTGRAGESHQWRVTPKSCGAILESRSQCSVAAARRMARSHCERGSGKRRERGRGGGEKKREEGGRTTERATMTVRRRAGSTPFRPHPAGPGGLRAEAEHGNRARMASVTGPGNGNRARRSRIESPPIHPPTQTGPPSRRPAVGLTGPPSRRPALGLTSGDRFKLCGLVYLRGKSRAPLGCTHVRTHT